MLFFVVLGGNPHVKLRQVGLSRMSLIPETECRHGKHCNLAYALRRRFVVAATVGKHGGAIPNSPAIRVCLNRRRDGLFVFESLLFCGPEVRFWNVDIRTGPSAVT